MIRKYYIFKQFYSTLIYENSIIQTLICFILTFYKILQIYDQHFFIFSFRFFLQGIRNSRFRIFLYIVNCLQNGKQIRQKHVSKLSFTNLQPLFSYQFIQPLYLVNSSQSYLFSYIFQVHLYIQPLLEYIWPLLYMSIILICNQQYL
ncbi:hypothetical protein IMG5_176080 [Ichthyophthirius multifiliis]|uniref:Transmembrane protein n=1 Tax=Ichthyophthirius multifiliis TaxID=5932 RepID=G0R297_ICHMU|nr:hypothetical protein IMG5_176080 [Ichthyophthirius multifiliis]EGR28422.1 hypothetical protein IMG5_176080 [Ichthyophthirius multifiliis]|eukprot:XP_004029658.1 hypothetical protein IMG5_176080 [Ichthyophthirius multifiliis]